MTATIHPSTLLRNALYADAAVSGAVAWLQLTAGDALARLSSLPAVLLFESGVFLVGYVALLLALARCRRLWSALVWAVVAGNVGWALGCAVLPALLAAPPSAAGFGFLALQAAAVLVFAALEWTGLRASPRADPQWRTAGP